MNSSNIITSSNLDVRVYPIAEPQGATLAFASIAVDDLAAIRGVRVVESAKGLFVAMPQSQDNTGIYHDVAFPLTKELRREISEAVLDEFTHQVNLSPELRGYEKRERSSDFRDADEVDFDVKVFPVAEPKGGTLAFASVSFDDLIAIRGIRVVGGDKGPFVSMPQSKDREGGFHDVAFPLSGDVRKAVSNAILADYKQQTAEKKRSVAYRLASGKDAAERHNSERAARPRDPAAKRAPGLEV
jgi:stage V sporulation protein G